MGGRGGGTLHFISKKVGIHPAVKLCERPWGGGGGGGGGWEVRLRGLAAELMGNGRGLC